MKKILFILCFIPVFLSAQVGRDYKGVTNSDTLKTPHSMETFGDMRARLDSLIALILLRMKYTDSTTMLSPYFKAFQAAAYKLITDSGRVGSNYVTAASDKKIVDSIGAILITKFTTPARPGDGNFRFLGGNNATDLYFTRTVNGHSLSFSNIDVTATDVGLGSVNNTSDLSKPISTATQTALDLKLTITDTTGQMGPYLAFMIANKQLLTTTASSATPTPTGNAVINKFTITALATAPTFAAPSGTPADGNELWIRIKDNGTARALAFNAIYRASADLGLPTTTIISKTMYLKFIYNSASTTWDFVSLLDNF